MRERNGRQPASPTRLGALLARVLGVNPDTLDVDASFFAHGLDSLGAVTFARAIADALGRPVPITSLWAHPSLAALAAALDGDAAAEVEAGSAGDGPAQRMIDPTEPIAIVGMACRFPGAEDIDAFWRLLVEGVDAITDPPPGRWPGIERFGRFRGGFVDDVARFDAAFFGISPREAAAMDPQQRMMLELCWQALESAGQPPDGLRGSRTGVFCGAIWSDYGHLVDRQGPDRASHAVTGNHRSLLANRVSFMLGLQGPSMALDSACSSGLVAVHLAAESLRRGESHLALAGAVNLNVLGESTVSVDRFGGLSPDGRCFTFDARANGYVRGEGGAVLVLKRLADAIADGDPIEAVVLGTAVNNDGASNGLTAPNPQAQIGVLRDALTAANVRPHAVQYVEAHGTGTGLGDPIEASALHAVYGVDRPRPLRIGSAKTNVGHLEGAAGLVGLIKAALCLRHRRLVPSLHFRTPNPAIPFDVWRLRVQTEAGPWPAPDERLVAGVSSFGLGGTNSHAVLGEWRPRVAFVMPGQGAQWTGMGRDLLESSPAFRTVIDRCDAWLRARAGWSLIDELRSDAPRFDRIEISLVAIIAIDVALAAHWRARGLEPAAVVGHSTGEIAAACVAGALSIEDTMQVISAYGDTIARQRGDGAMGVVGVDWDAAAPLVEGAAGRVYRAIRDSVATTVLAGEPAALDRVLAAAAARGIFARRVSIDVSPHCPRVAHLLADLRAKLAGITPRPTRVPLYSEVTGGVLPGEALDVEHWVANFGEAATFSGAIDAVLGDGIGLLLEVGPHALLRQSLDANLRASGIPGRTLASLERGADGPRALARTDATLVDLGALAPADGAVSLPLLISAPDEPARAVQITRWAEWAAETGAPWPGVARSAALRRTGMPHRAAVTARSTAEAAAALAALAAGEGHPAAVTGRRVEGQGVVFVFPGQGGQWAGMGQALLGASPAFAEAIDAVEVALAPHVGWSLRAVLAADDGAPPLDRVDVIQPALFGMAYGIARLWAAHGVTPTAVVGHSQGEIAAAVVAGALSLADGARLVAVRSALVARLAGTGAMAFIGLSGDAVEARIAGRDGLSLAAVNSAESTVIAGDPKAVDGLLAELAADGVFCRRVAVDYASHSPHVDPLLPELRDRLGDLRPVAPAIAMISTVTGAPIEGPALDAGYWCRNLRAPVRLDQALAGLGAGGWPLFIEISPHPGLTVPIRAAVGPTGAAIGTLRRGDGGLGRFRRALAEGWCRGLDVDWPALMPPAPRVALPPYVFGGDRHWLDAAPLASEPGALGQLDGGHPLLTSIVELPDSATVVTGVISLARQPWLADHVVAGQVVVPGAVFAEMGLWAAGRAGASGVRELTLTAPMVLEAEQEYPIRVMQTATRLTIHGQSPGGRWTLHAEGQIGDVAAPVASAGPWPPARAEAMAVATAYADFAGLGFDYGPCFRGITAAWRTSDGLCAEVACPPLGRAPARFGLHPALLDAALHAGLLLGAEGLVLPFAWRDLRLAASGATRLRVTLRRRAATLSIDVTDPAGRPLARVGAVDLRPIDRGMLDRARRRQPYRLSWPEPQAGAPVDLTRWAGVGGGASGLAGRRLVDPLDGAEAPPPGVLVRLGRAPGDEGSAARGMVVDALTLMQRWLAEPRLAATRLVFITDGAVSVDEAPVDDLAQASLWGLVGSADAEHPGRFGLVDVDGSIDAAALALALAADEARVVIRGGRLRAPRLGLRDPLPALAMPDGPWRLTPGAGLDGLRLTPIDAPAPGAGQVRIEVRAAALNFRDVLVATGLRPDDPRPIGSDVAGVVRAVGAGVDDVRPGDRVMGFAFGGLASTVATDRRLVTAAPEGWGFAEAAGWPTALCTAWYGLIELADLAPGQKVLIHAATGGVGMAAVQLARWRGAEVFATASPPKWSTLRAMGFDDAHIASSRDLDFERVFAAHGPLDVVLDSLVGPFVDASLRLLGPGGLFLEMGKRDIRSPDDIARVAPGVRYRPFDLAARIDDAPDAIAGMLAEITPLLADGTLRPLPARAFDIRRAPAAFGLLARAAHRGKVVLTPPQRLDPDGTVLISGATGGVGRRIALHLVEHHGARRLLLLSRSGPRAPGAEVLIEALAAAGADASVVPCDVSDGPALAQVIDAVPAEHPLTAVVHAAGVLDDGTLATLDAGQVARVMGPKLDGALNLDRLTRGHDLAAFVLFSSAAGVMGTPGQANYAAANAALDALAARRRAAGLPAISLDWGAWDEGGMIAGLGDADRARLARSGVPLMRPAVGLSFFDAALSAPGVQLVPMVIDPAAMARSGGVIPAVFRGLVRRAPPARAVSGEALADRLAMLDAPGRRAALIDVIRAEAATVAGRAGSGPIAADAVFAELGIDSLMAVELRNRLAGRIGLRLPATLVFEHPDVARLADALLEMTEPASAAPAARDEAGDARRALDVLMALPDEALERLDLATPLAERFAPKGPPPLSAGQARLWFLEQVITTPGTYTVHIGWTIGRAIDPAALSEALHGLGARHEQLRVRFVERDGGPVQVVDDAPQLDPIVRDLSPLPEAERDAALVGFEAELGRAPFDLAAGPLARFGLARLAPERHVIIAAMHHSIVDGRSIQRIFAELSARYGALEAGDDPPPVTAPPSYTRFARGQRRWLASAEAERQRTFWRAALAGVEPLTLPTDKPRPTRRAHVGAYLPFRVEAALADRLDGLARSAGCTPFTVLLGAWSHLLGRMAAADDFVVGTVVAGRNDPAFDDTVGFFVRTVPVRCRPARQGEVVDWLGALGDDVVAALRHAALPYDEIVRESPATAGGSPGEDPLIQAAFILEDGRSLDGWTFAGAPMEPRPGPVSGDVAGTAKFELSLAMMRSPSGYRASIEYATDLFEAGTAELVRDRLLFILARMAERAPVAALRAVPPGERRRLRAWGNIGATPAPRPTVPEQFAAQVERTPDLPAIAVADEVLDYRGLGRRVERFARSLRALGVTRGVRVGVHLGRSFDLPAALLAILRAGGTFVPLDPAYPAARLRYMAEDAEARVVLTDAPGAGGWPAGATVVPVERLADSAPAVPFGPPDPRDLAYIIYTSGSTGRPKGVMIEHGGLAAVLHEMRALMRPEPGERAMSITTISFDPFVLELFGPLMGGGLVDLVDTATARDADALIARIVATRPTVLQATPVTWRMLIDRGLPDAHAPRVLCGGEAMDVALARTFAAWSPSVHNIYGPTEITIWATAWKVPPAPARARIGLPYEGVACHVLDADGEPCPIGVPGELYLGGPRVAPGYCNRPDLTDERFTPDPTGPPGARRYRTGDRVRWAADGELDFLGRMDRQVKLRGHRIELGEVEAALGEHPAVANCGVIVRTSESGHLRLVAYYAAVEGTSPPSRDAVREHLAGILHANMVPEGIVCLDVMPETPNGKVDRVALAALPDERSALLGAAPPPADDRGVGPSVRAAVAAVLGLPDGRTIAADLPLRALGLNSLAAVELRNRLERTFDLRLPITLAFDHPTLTALSAAVSDRLEPEPARWDPAEISAHLARLDLDALAASPLLEGLMRLPTVADAPPGDEASAGAGEDDLLDLAARLLGESR